MGQNKVIKAAFAGNPNSGKTSLFNAVAGTNLKVGNWSGVTVEKYEAEVEYEGYTINFVDLPGTYSLTAYSPEETVARDYIESKEADVIVNVADGTNLERSLYLSVQLLELQPKTIMALNMYDEVEEKGIKIDFKMLQQLLGCHVIPVSAAKKTGLESLLSHIVRLYEGKITPPEGKITYSDEVEDAIEKLQSIVEADPLMSSKLKPRLAAIKLLEQDAFTYNTARHSPAWIRLETELPPILKSLEAAVKMSIQKKIAEDRHSFVRGAFKETVTEKEQDKKTATDIIDSVLINRVLGLPVFFVIMWLIFQMTFKLGEAPMGWIETFFNWLGNTAGKNISNNLLRSIVADGIVAGVGGVLVFLPNILLLFFGLSFLEATGYMARAAFVVDKAFHKIGLHGKSFIPMVTGFGCSVPAFMACRTLKNRGDRLATMMVIPFMSCGAKLPVYVLLIGAFFPENAAGNILFGVYLFGILVAVASAKLFKSTVFKGQSEPFVMELPVYRMPSIQSVLMQMWMKAWMYMKKAGTTILAASLIIWFASNFPVNHKLADEYAQKTAAVESMKSIPESEKQSVIKNLRNELAGKELEYSFAGKFGRLVEPVIKPLGFDWRVGVALTAGIAAKEIVVSTMGTIYSLGDIGEETSPLKEKLRADPAYNTASALALIIFVLLYVPCLAATAVFHKEIGRLKITLFYIAYSMATAWVLSFMVYRIALLFIK
ncbi:MAG TPA: ferrous iron transport protein B [Candidatus Goldiibacteriota bacterium]|nr:ferrous iron transport protein B [Candidatus Goldiibacteriota bacterium]HRQ44468.1 ferrous iron transport protein B [Candidatus Goldiibacteriota bacterium]